MSRLAALVARRLRDAGHEAWYVGGCVRDELLGRIREEVTRRVVRLETVPGGLQETLNQLELRQLDLDEAAYILYKKSFE